METTKIPVDFDLGPAKRSLEELKRSVRELSKPIAAPEWMKQQPERSHTMGTTFTPTSTAADGSKAGQTRLDPAAQQTQRQYAQNVRDTTDLNRQQRTSQREETLARAESRRGMARRTSEGPTADGTTRKTMTDVALQVSRQAQAAGGIGGPLGSVLSTLLRGSPLGALIGGTIGAGLVAANIQGAQTTNRYSLGAAFTGADLSKLQRNDVYGPGWNYRFSPDTAIKMASSLGSQGVSATNVGGILQNVMAEVGVNPNVNQDQLSQVAGQMSTKGGASSNDIGKTFDLLNKQASSTGISVNQMTQSLLDFAQASGGMAMGFSGAKQIMGIQKELNPNAGDVQVSAGQVIAPLANASGANLAILANMAGVTQDQALAMQEGNQGGLSAFTDKLAKNMWAQTSGSQAEKETQFMQTNQTLGDPFALANLPAKTRDQTILRLKNGQAKADEQAMGQQAGPVSAKSLQAAGQKARQSQVTGTGLLGLIKDYLVANAGNDAIGGGPLKGDALTQNMLTDVLGMSATPWIAQLLADSTSGSGAPKANASADTLRQWVAKNPKATLGDILGETKKLTPASASQGSADPKKSGSDGGGLWSDIKGFFSNTLLATATAHAASGDAVTTQTNIAQTRKNTDVMAQWFQQHPNATAGDFLVSQITPPGWTPGTGKIPPTPGKPAPGKPGGGTPIPGKPASATVNGTAVPAAIMADDVAAAKGDPAMLKLLLQQQMQESSFNPKAISPAGAVGLAQFMPATASGLNAEKGSPFYGKTFDPTNPAQAAKMEVFYMQQLMRQTGSTAKALGAYYGDNQTGPGSYSSQVQSIKVTITDATSKGVSVKVDPSRKPAGSENSTMRGHIRGGNGLPSRVR